MQTSEKTTHSHIVDVQGRLDSRAVSINKVGIKGLRHPLNIATAQGDIQPTVALCNLYVNLNADQKGTHMSRFLEIINNYTEALTPQSLHDLLERVATHLNADDAYIEFNFPFFVNKTAPVSGVNSLLDYDVLITGEYTDGAPHIHLQVKVPVTSLCPCSKEISRYGAHNQRSEVSITVYNIHHTESLWIEDIIAISEQQASCELYGILKRPDEKYVTEKAYENPKFVEDMVRDIAAVLNSNSRVGRYQVTAENFESIHNHSAFAVIDSLV